MNKHFAICPNGQRVTRNSARRYRYVVVGRSSEFSENFRVAGWASRRDLAEKQAASAGHHWDDVTILPVEIAGEGR